MADPHEILGVAPGSSPRAIRQAFLRQAKRQHPDRAGTHAGMTRLNQAYQALKHPTMTRRSAEPLHRAPRRSRLPRGGRLLSAEAARFVETVLLPLDRLLGLAITALLDALEGRATESVPAIASRARLTLELTGARLARAEWPDELTAARRSYGEGLRLLSDALEDLEGAVAEARVGLRSGLARLRSALSAAV